MERRKFLQGALSLGTVMAGADQLGAITAPPVIDSHIHLFDPTRAGGVPWPEPGDLIYKPTLPGRYESIAAPFGVVGAVAIEASPLASDNDWMLNVVERNPVMLGMIGDLVPGWPDYGRELARLQKNPLFLGIRYGNLWKRNLLQDQEKAGFMDGLKDLAQANLVLELANPNADLIEAARRVAAKVPELTIVIDHLPHAVEPTEAQSLKMYRANLAELGTHARVFVKLSEIVTATNGKVDKDASVYARKLDPLWELFGPDRVIFGSDWPNSDHVASYDDTFGVVRTYLDSKGAAASRKYFADNSRRAYGWKPRRANQHI